MEPSFYLLMSLALPLLGALLSFLFKEKMGWWTSLLLGLTLANSVLLCCHCFNGGPVAVSAGAWASPYGITLIVDPFACLMLVASNGVFFASLLGKRQSSKRFLFTLCFLLQTGVTLSFITGDLFNLFVAFELMLTSSYALITLHGRPSQSNGSYPYLVMNILASFFYLIAVAAFYSATGSLNFAELANQMREVPTYPGLVLLLAITLVMMIKGGVFPFYYWLPDSYPLLPSHLGAIFGGILSKVGIYALFRIYYTVFSGSDLGTFSLLLILACLTMLLGVLGAMSRGTVKGILSYHILSQVGYMVLALVLATPLAIAAGIFFILHNMVVKSSLILLGGIAEKKCQTGHLNRMGGVWRAAPALGFLFFIQALSLAGIPPLSGFWPKYFLFFEGMRLESYWAVIIAVITSFFTLFSMVKIWNKGFLGTSVEELIPTPRVAYLGPSLLTALALLMGALAHVPFRLCDRAAQSLLDSQVYVATSLEVGTKGRGQ